MGRVSSALLGSDSTLVSVNVLGISLVKWLQTKLTAAPFYFQAPAQSRLVASAPRRATMLHVVGCNVVRRMCGRPASSTSALTRNKMRTA